MRLFIDSRLETGSEVCLNDSQGHYLRHVMRLGSGSSLIVFDGTGGEYLAEITCLSKQRTTCRIHSFDNINRELLPEIHIVQAACRNEKIETVLQKGTELGASGFQIAASERSDMRLSREKLASRLQRWQKVIIEAAEQSGRTCIPAIRWCPDLDAIKLYGLSFCLHPDTLLSWASVRKQIKSSPALTFAIGPEGGWSKRDRATLELVGFQPLSFGSRILRTETAAPALLAAVQAIID